MLAEYVVERLPIRLIVPVAACLTLAARADAGLRPSMGLATDLVVLLLLFAQFRLWDDLADRAHDAVQHPHRALVRAASDRPFYVLAAVLFATNAIVISQVYAGAIPLTLFLAITLVTGVWYALRGGRSVGGDHLILLKYPAFVTLVAVGRHVERPALVACSALAVYLGACVYEAVHDAASPAARHQFLVVGEALLLIAASSAALVIGVRS